MVAQRQMFAHDTHFASESTKVAEALFSLLKSEKFFASKIKISTRVLRFRPS